MELEVEEHGQADLLYGADPGGAVGTEELEPELHAADVMVDLLRQTACAVEVGCVERNEDTVRHQIVSDAAGVVTTVAGGGGVSGTTASLIERVLANARSAVESRWRSRQRTTCW